MHVVATSVAKRIPNLATTVLLADAAEEDGARCLDGSPQRYWIQHADSGSINATKWVVFIMGGAWCTTPENCAKRAYHPASCYLGSSNASCFFNDSSAVPGATFSTVMDFYGAVGFLCS